MKKYALLLLLLTTVFIGCKNALELEAEKKVKENDEQIQAYLIAQKLSAKKTATGLYYIITPGSGTRVAKAPEQVTMHYLTRRISDNIAIDSTAQAANKPDFFPFGIGYRIAGLEEGIALMKEGDKATFLIPSHLSYGSKVFDVLPAYSVIRMDVTFVSSRTEDEQIEEYIAKNKLTVTEKTDKGLRYIVTKASTADSTLKTGQVITVKYSGALLREIRKIQDSKFVYSTVFDSGTFNFTLGAGKVVEGFDTGVSKMRVGGKAKLIFPSAIGYADKGSGDIPPYTPLMFDIEILSAK